MMGGLLFILISNFDFRQPDPVNATVFTPSLSPLPSMAHRDKCRHFPRYIDNPTGLLRQVGRAIWQNGKTQSYTTPGLAVYVKCLLCNTWRAEKYYGDVAIAKQPTTDAWEDEDHPYINITSKAQPKWLQPLVCGHCTRNGDLPIPVRLECSALIAQHTATKNVLQNLPQPIFEELWNEVGWDALQ